MTYQRFVPVLLLKEGLLARSQAFKSHQLIGDPIPTIRRLSNWKADEIFLLNISNTLQFDSRRDDKAHNIGKSTLAGLVEAISEYTFAPMTVGGGLRSLPQVEDLFSSGADKCCFNTSLFLSPELIRTCISRYGSQAVVASLDFRDTPKGLSCFTEYGRRDTGLSVYEALSYVKDLGVGEVIVSSIDREGSTLGYHPELLDLNLLGYPIPVIIFGGSTELDHFAKGLAVPNISGIAASNIFYFTENSYPLLKKGLIDQGENVRPFTLTTKYLTREPKYRNDFRDRFFDKLKPASKFNPSKYDGSSYVEPKYCKRCLYPLLSATPMQLGEDGICMGCVTSDVKSNYTSVEYDRRSSLLQRIINKQLSDSPDRTYDCIVSVSGGKDSYYQVHHVINILGLKPLLVTYNGNNYTETGWRNLHNMRRVFDVDHIIISPSVPTLIKLNKLAFVAMGDMNWHAHVGIFTSAAQIAVQNNIPLIFWGEHGYADLCGQFTMDDFPEANYRERLEHDARGFEWNFFVGMDGLTSQDMRPWMYPSDSALLSLNLRQIFLGHYIPWESNNHLELVVRQYGFEVSPDPFDRTYRIGSNLDDMHENGVHDFLKYIKFAYGRCTDHASKDIRAGLLDREEGLELVRKYDHVVPKDLERWLEYVGMSESEFYRIADHFRDPRIWRYENDVWVEPPRF
jgi:N-acetyl sugar amidotransferase